MGREGHEKNEFHFAFTVKLFMSFNMKKIMYQSYSELIPNM